MSSPEASTSIGKSPSDSEILMNLLEWTQQKIGSGLQIVKEMGNMLDLRFLQDQDSVNKQVSKQISNGVVSLREMQNGQCYNVWKL